MSDDSRFALRLAACVGGILAAAMGLCLAGFGLLLAYDAAGKWHRDYVPDAEMRESLRRAGYSVSISRIVEAGYSAFPSDGVSLVVRCFSPSDVPQMCKMLGGNEEWKSGFPAPDGWSGLIVEFAPRELVIENNMPSVNFIHLPSKRSLYWTIIDTKRGISYQLIVDT